MAEQWGQPYYKFLVMPHPVANLAEVDLDWLDGRAGSPVVLVLHGLEGSSSSHYVQGLVRECRARAWRAVALNFRSCSGELNRLPRFYHSGETRDLDWVVQQVVAREP